MSAKSYSRILGSNDRVRVGIVGYFNRFRSSGQWIAHQIDTVHWFYIQSESELTSKGASKYLVNSQKLISL